MYKGREREKERVAWIRELGIRAGNFSWVTCLAVRMEEEREIEEEGLRHWGWYCCWYWRWGTSSQLRILNVFVIRLFNVSYPIQKRDGLEIVPLMIVIGRC